MLSEIKKIFIEKIINIVSIVSQAYKRKSVLPDAEKVKHITVMHFGGIGDTILITPSLKGLFIKTPLIHKSLAIPAVA